MRKLITIILVLAASVAFGQTTYQLNYDSIRVGKTAGNGATSLYGKTYLKNATEGTPSDSVLTVRNGRVYKIAGSAISSVGFLTYVFSRDASDISGYEQMPALTSYTAGAADTATVAATTTPAIIQEFATNTGFPNTTLIPSGVFNVTYQTQKNSGSQSYYTYAVIYKRNLSGTETAIATTNNSSSVSANTVQSVSVSALSPTDISVLTTDRIVVKVFAVMVSGTANISIYYDDATDSRLAFPSALVDATNFVPYNGAVKDLVSSFSITGDSIKRVGGTGAQFLMGNGTVQDTTQIQTVSNFFPKGDTRYAKSFSNYKTAYVDTLGDNTTAILGRQDKPFATVSAALASLPASGGKIKIGIGSFASPTGFITQSNIIIEGSGMPATNGVDSVLTLDNELVTSTPPTKLIGGTILKGTFKFRAVSNVKVSDLGIDVGYAYVTAGGTEGDGISFGLATSGDTTTTTPLLYNNGIVLKNISSLNLSAGSLNHAVLVENAYEPVLDNIHTYYGVHGIAIKSIGGIMTNIFAHGHGFNGIIIKSDNYAYSSQINLSNFRISSIGSNDGGGINVQTQGGVHNYIKISNGIIYRTKFGIQSVEDMPLNMDIDNVSVINTIGYGFWVTNAGQYVKISNSLAKGNLFDGFHVNANAAYSLLSNNSSIDNGGDGFDLSSGLRTDFDNLLAIGNTGYGIRANSNVYGGTKTLIDNTAGATTGTILDRITSFTGLTVYSNPFGNSLTWTDNTNNTGYLGIRSAAASIGADNKLQFETANTERGSFSSSGVFKVNNLSGSGNRIGYYNSSGEFKAAVIGSGLSLNLDTLTATGGTSATFSGNVLIGTTTDNGAKLQVNGNSTLSSRVAIGGGDGKGITIDANSSSLTIPTTGLNFQTGFNVSYISSYNTSNSLTGLYIGSSLLNVSSLGTGTVYSNAGTLTNTNPSDANLKTEIKNLSYGLNEIIQLRPVSYLWKEDKINQGKQFGFIAQDVQEVMPELVKQGEYLGLDKEAIFVILVNAIKELKAEIDILKNK